MPAPPYASSVALCAKVLTVSDRVAAGTSEDASGPALARRLIDAGFSVTDQRVVPDGVESVSQALREMTEEFCGLVVTTGGTGFSPRDLTPEATLAVVERTAPGFAELMRTTHPLGALSRSQCGIVGAAIVVNTPGSPTGAVECLEVLLPLLPHALAVVDGGPVDHPPETGGRTATSS